MEKKEKSMEKPKGYIEHSGKAVERDERFEHVMAITLDPITDNREGIIRCITSRTGDVEVLGYVDRSELHVVKSDSPDHFEIGDRLAIKNEREIIEQLADDEFDFIGLEDPDIWIDEEKKLMHVYFTIPLRHKSKEGTITHLGHAVGKDFHSLEMTEPVLMSDDSKGRAKEVSIAPLNSKGFRYNLFESSDRKTDRYSTVRVAKVEDMGKTWEWGDEVFHPAEHNISWIAGHASPGPLLPKSFIDIGDGKLVGIMNGREANQHEGDHIKYGMFSVGLFIYDYEHGKIDWVSPEPFIQDSEAKTITFASQFVEEAKGSGVLYAHVDDSFVRAYSLDAEEIKKLLPKER